MQEVIVKVGATKNDKVVESTGGVVVIGETVEVNDLINKIL